MLAKTLVESVDYTNKSAFSWISVIRLPDFISKADFDWAVETATKKKMINNKGAYHIVICPLYQRLFFSDMCE